MISKEYFKKLGVNKEPHYDDVEMSYSVELDDSDEFSRVYTMLDNADWLHLISGDLSLSTGESILVYESDDESFIFLLDADFENNKYTLKLEE